MATLITKPTVHMNGTSGDRLMEGYDKAAKAVRQALFALNEAAPNARDYYVQGSSAYAAARGEHEQRCTRLREMHEELCAIMEHIQDQIDARDAQRSK